MADTLEIRLGGAVDGRPVSLQTVDFHQLSPLVDSIAAAALIEAGVDPVFRSPQSPSRPLALALSNVTGGAGTVTANYGFAVGPVATEAVGRITAGLAGDRNARLVPRAAGRVHDGLTKAIRRGLTVQLVNGVTTPTFTAANPPPRLSVHPTRKFTTEIAVRLLRAGGKKPAARVQFLGSGHEATVHLQGVEAVRELGSHLYGDAVLTGFGEWVVDPNAFYRPTRLLSFKVSDYRLLGSARVDDVVRDLTGATGGAWDDVDPANPDEVMDVPGGRR